MGSGIYLAGSAMVSREARQVALAHNIANVSTPGYKAARLFGKVLTEVGRSVESIREAARSQQIYIDFSQGMIQGTDGPLDLALEGEGFFVVLTPRGERFTRNGNFSPDATGQLVDRSGFPVLSESGPITLGQGTVVVDERGDIFVDREPVGRLLVKNFASTEGLAQEGGCLFGPRPGSELEEAECTARVFQGCLESSNVLPVDEMVRMTCLLRSYESCQRILRMQSETLGRLANEMIPE